VRPRRARVIDVGRRAVEVGAQNVEPQGALALEMGRGIVGAGDAHREVLAQDSRRLRVARAQVEARQAVQAMSFAHSLGAAVPVPIRVSCGRALVGPAGVVLFIAHGGPPARTPKR
jgi:hypothetical protein